MSAIRAIKAEQSRRFNCVVDSAQGDQGACRLMLAKKDYLSNNRGGNLFGSVGIVERSDPWVAMLEKFGGRCELGLCRRALL